ncbi:MAG: flagellar basal body-associated protein FliL [Kiloniellaceae bacterium]
MNRLAILIVLMLLVAGAAGAGWWFFLRGNDGTEARGEAEQTEEIGPGGQPIKLKRFIELEPIVLPIIRQGRVILHVTLVPVVELLKPMTLQEVRRTTPILRDAFLTELHAIFALRYVQERGFDLPIVKKRLTRASERVLGPGKVRMVLIQNISQRKPARG